MTPTPLDPTCTHRALVKKHFSFKSNCFVNLHCLHTWFAYASIVAHNRVNRSENRSKTKEKKKNRSQAVRRCATTAVLSVTCVVVPWTFCGKWPSWGTLSLVSSTTLSSTGRLDAGDNRSMLRFFFLYIPVVEREARRRLRTPFWTSTIKRRKTNNNNKLSLNFLIFFF